MTEMARTGALSEAVQARAAMAKGSSCPTSCSAVSVGSSLHLEGRNGQAMMSRSRKEAVRAWGVGGVLSRSFHGIIVEGKGEQTLLQRLDPRTLAGKAVEPLQPSAALRAGKVLGGQATHLLVPQVPCFFNSVLADRAMDQFIIFPKHPALEAQDISNLSYEEPVQDVSDLPSFPNVNEPMLAIKRTYQPHTRRRKRKHGFLHRLKYNKNVLKRRKLKGRHRLTPV